MRAKSEEHRQVILKSHYHMQQLKTTIQSIKANKYTTPTDSPVSAVSKDGGLTRKHMAIIQRRRAQENEVYEQASKEYER